MQMTTYRVTYRPDRRSGLPWYSVIVTASTPAEARRLADRTASREAPRHRYASTAPVQEAAA